MQHDPFLFSVTGGAHTKEEERSQQGQESAPTVTLWVPKNTVRYIRTEYSTVLLILISVRVKGGAV